MHSPSLWRTGRIFAGVPQTAGIFAHHLSARRVSGISRSGRTNGNSRVKVHGEARWPCRGFPRPFHFAIDRLPRGIAGTAMRDTSGKVNGSDTHLAVDGAPAEPICRERLGVAPAFDPVATETPGIRRSGIGVFKDQAEDQEDRRIELQAICRPIQVCDLIQFGLSPVHAVVAFGVTRLPEPIGGVQASRPLYQQRNLPSHGL